MERMTGWLSKQLGWIILMLVVWAVLVSCQPGSTELPFETVMQAEDFWTGHDYAEKEPALLIITSTEEIDTPGIDVQFNPDLVEELRAVDYQTRFVGIIFRGQLGGMSPDYAIDILRVTRSGDRVVIETHFGELGPEQGALMSLSSPYYAVSIAKEGLRGREIQFVLKEDGRTVAERSHFIP